MKNVKINIKSTQGIDGQTEKIEFFCEGTLQKTDDGFLIEYDDENISEGQKVSTVLHLKSDKSAVLERTGAMNSKLVIKEGERNDCFYSVPGANLVIGIYGERVAYTLSENGGMVCLIYTIDQNRQQISKNKVNIIIKEV